MRLRVSVQELLLLFIVVRALIFGDQTDGWPSLVSIILFVSGVQLLCIGIIGKYIGKIFLETKKRPIYTKKPKKNKKMVFTIFFLISRLNIYCIFREVSGSIK